MRRKYSRTPLSSICRKTATTSAVVMVRTSRSIKCGRMLASSAAITWAAYFGFLPVPSFPPSVAHLLCQSYRRLRNWYAVSSSTGCSAFGLMPRANLALIWLRQSLASARLKSGYNPSVMVSCLLSSGLVYVSRHDFPPLGNTHKASPPPSDSLYSLSFGFAFFTWLTERGRTILGMIMVRGRMYQIKYHKKKRNTF